MNRILGALALAALTGWGAVAGAASPGDFLARFTDEARRADAGFSASPERGERFFDTVRGSEWSCASCHTRNPAAIGSHAATGKRIEPMAPAVNPKRFVSNRAVEKWFRRNCNDVLARECSAAEKADVIAYLMSVRP